MRSLPPHHYHRFSLHSLPSVIPSTVLLRSTVTSRRSSLLPYLLVLLIPSAVCASIPSCGARLVFESPAGLAQKGAFTHFDNDTYACVDEIVRNGAPENSSLDPWNPCTADLLTVDVGAYAIFPSKENPMFLPYVNLNLSVTVHSTEVRSVFVRLECVKSDDGADIYCNANPQKQMAALGRVVWPCRGVAVPESGLTEKMVPFAFAFDCFRLTPHSLYLVNVTAFPGGCSTSMLLTMPSASSALPSIHKFYEAPKTPVPFAWSPIVVVDLTSSDDGVWLRALIPEAVEWRTLTFNLYEVTSDGNLRIVREWNIDRNASHPVTGIKWTDAPRGEYSLWTYVRRHDCSLFCEGVSPCNRCPSTSLPFRLERDYFSTLKAVMRRARDVSAVAVPTILAIIVVCTGAVAAYVYAVRAKTRRKTQEIPLKERPQVLLLYSADCELHSRAAKEVASLLHDVAHANIAIDQEDLVSAGTRPSHWLVDRLVYCSRVLLLLSPSTPSIVVGKRQLRPTPPFPDTLMAAMPLVLTELTKCAGAPSTSRIAILRLPYSPPLPDQFAILGARSFSVLDDLPAIVTFIHGLEHQRNASTPHATPDKLAPVERAVREVEGWLAAAPSDWLDARMEDADSKPPLPIDVGAIELMRERGCGTDKTMEELASEFGMLPPDEEPVEDVERGQRMERREGEDEDEGIQSASRPAPSSLTAAWQKYNEETKGDPNAVPLLPPDSDEDD